MTEFLTILLSVLYSVAFGLRNAHQLKELLENEQQRTSNAELYNTLWHFFQGVVQVLFGVAIALYDGILAGVMFGFIFSLVFDLTRNLAAGEKFDYLGATKKSGSRIDLFLLKFNPRVVFIVKSILTAGAIALYLCF